MLLSVLKEIMDEAIPSVVSASYQFMAWAKDIARQVNRHDTYLEWITPIGTKVKHNYYEEDIVRLDVLNRRVNIQTVSEDNPRLIHQNSYLVLHLTLSIALMLVTCYLLLMQCGMMVFRFQYDP